MKMAAKNQSDRKRDRDRDRTREQTLDMFVTDEREMPEEPEEEPAAFVGEETKRAPAEVDVAVDVAAKNETDPGHGASPLLHADELELELESEFEFEFELDEDAFTLIHTSDWHLGQKLANHDRKAEHDAFLHWLLDQLQHCDADALLVCGDIFDSANPPISAIRQFTTFFVAAIGVCDNIVIIAGNHDSVGRLDALEPFLTAIGVHLVTSLRGDIEDCLLTLTDANAEPAAVVAAIPYLRAVDLPPPPAGEAGDDQASRLCEAMSAVYGAVDEAYPQTRSQRQNERELPLIVTGHLFVRGGRQSKESERPVQLSAGRLQVVPATIFPSHSVYVALGHLHRPQQIDADMPVYYSGAPIPLSFGEARNRQCVNIVQFPSAAASPNRASTQTSVVHLPVPRLVEMYDVRGDFDTVCEELDALVNEYPAASTATAKERGGTPHRAAVARVTVQLSEPVPDLRARVTERVERSAVIILAVRREGDERWGLPETMSHEVELEELAPPEVFRLMYRSNHDDDPPEELFEAFETIYAEVQSEHLPEEAPGGG